MSFPAEAQIARELMKFAANGTLYRGSKPVMWSVVEKTALAEAEVEYEDYTSDTVWVKFPVRDIPSCILWGDPSTSTSQDLSCATEGKRCHLDDDALDAARQSRDQLFAEDRIRPLSQSPTPRPTIGRRLASYLCWPRSWPPEVFKQARVSDFERLASGSCMRCSRRLLARIRSQATSGYDFRCRCSPAITSPTTPARASCTLRPATAARISTSGSRIRRELEARGINPAIPYTVDENGAFTEAGAGLHRQTRHQRQRREGRRQRGGDQGA